jgi:hypothetical protein
VIGLDFTGKARRAVFFYIACFAMLYGALESAAYTVTQPQATWPCGDVVLEPHLGLVGGVLADGRISWDQVAEDAMAVWNANLATIRLRSRSTAGGCADLDGRNSICWRSPVEEPALEDAVAITWRWRIGSEAVEADILVNNTQPWESYRGAKCDFTQCFSEHDLRRVLLHELGHAIGLAHEDDVPSAMATRISDIDTLTSDDVAGGRFLYPPDGGRPSIKVSAPTNNARVTDSPLIVRGSASDNCLVSHMLYQLNTNATVTVTGTVARSISWNFPVTPRPGSNVIRVWSVDTSTNRSLAVQKAFFYSVRAPLTVQIDGAGASTPANGTRLEIGRGYQITAAPAAGNLFRGWWDTNGDLLSSKAKFSFIMQSNLVLGAQFITNPFPRLAGSYNGLFYRTNGVSAESSGFLKLTLSAQGSYSTLIRSAGKTNSFTGKFDPITGQSRVTVKRGTIQITFDLKLDFSGASEALTGTVRTAGWEAWLYAPRFGFSAGSPATNLAGRYTLRLFAKDDAEPQGYGYSSATVDAAGRVVMLGKLPEGHSFSHSASLSADGLWPLYSHSHGGKGLVLNWLTFIAPSSVAESEGTWIRPALPAGRFYPEGFTNLLVASGSPYNYVRCSRSLNATNAVVVLMGGNLPEPLTNQLAVATNGQFVNLSSNALRITVNTTSGVYTGSVSAGGRTLKLSGALFQNEDRGLGFFSHTNKCGRVFIEPMP